MHFHYDAFENYFRGSREEVTAKLETYLPIVASLGIETTHPVLDIACGRGEWLEILRTHDVPAQGIDINSDFVTHCTEKGLSVEQHDLHEFLSRNSEPAYRLITGFHIIEHLDFEKQLELLNIIHDRLVTGGAMILETPNPENTMVGCSNFHIDPTHIRPVPHQLLKFLALQAGFTTAAIVKLNRHTVGTPLSLMPASLPGAAAFNQLALLVASQLQQAPDYALVAFKDVEPDARILALLDTINQETSAYSPRPADMDNLDEYLYLRQKELNTALVLLRQRDEELKNTYDQIQLRNNELKMAYAQIQQRNEQIHEAFLELEKHEDASLNSVSALKQMDSELKLAHAQIEKSNQEVQQISSLLQQRDLELHSTHTRVLHCEEEKAAQEAAFHQKEHELRQLAEQMDRLQQEYQSTLFALHEREKELKSVYNTAAGKFIHYYKSTKNKWKKRKTEAEPTRAGLENITENSSTDRPAEHSASVRKVYQRLLQARQKQHHQ